MARPVRSCVPSRCWLCRGSRGSGCRSSGCRCRRGRKSLIFAGAHERRGRSGLGCGAGCRCARVDLFLPPSGMQRDVGDAGRENLLREDVGNVSAGTQVHGRVHVRMRHAHACQHQGVVDLGAADALAVTAHVHLDAKGGARRRLLVPRWHAAKGSVAPSKGTVGLASSGAGPGLSLASGLLVSGSCAMKLGPSARHAGHRRDNSTLPQKPSTKATGSWTPPHPPVRHGGGPSRASPTTLPRVVSTNVSGSTQEHAPSTCTSRQSSRALP